MSAWDGLSIGIVIGAVLALASQIAAEWLLDRAEANEEARLAAEYDRRRGYDRPRSERAKEARRALAWDDNEGDA